MRLHSGNAPEYEGRVLDARKRWFHYYPLTVKRIKGRYYYQDQNGVLMPVPEKNDLFNAVYFDEVIQ